jgi:predicted small metal-binding protein
MLQLTCLDAGFSCDKMFVSNNEEDLLKQVREHASEVHSFEEENFTPELQRKIKTLIRRS